jgi:hypothetical protein
MIRAWNSGNLQIFEVPIKNILFEKSKWHMQCYYLTINLFWKRLQFTHERGYFTLTKVFSELLLVLHGSKFTQYNSIGTNIFYKPLTKWEAQKKSVSHIQFFRVSHSVCAVGINCMSNNEFTCVYSQFSPLKLLSGFLSNFIVGEQMLTCKCSFVSYWSNIISILYEAQTIFLRSVNHKNKLINKTHIFHLKHFVIWYVFNKNK